MGVVLTTLIRVLIGALVAGHGAPKMLCAPRLAY